MNTFFTRRLTPIALFAAALSACSPAPENPEDNRVEAPTATIANKTESERLTAFFERTFEEDLKRSPMFQSYLGKKWNYGDWDDISEDFQDRTAALKRNRLEELDSFNTDALNDQEKLSLELYRYSLNRDLENDAMRHHTYIVQQFGAAHTRVPSFLVNIHRITNVDDAKAYISRLDQVDKYFDQVIEQMKIREEAGVFPPKWAYDQMVVAAQNVITGAPFDDFETPSIIWEDFQNKVNQLSASDAEKQTLLGEAKATLVTSVKPAYEDLIDAFKQQKDKSPEGDGVWRQPDAEKWYANRLAWFTTTTLTASEIHQIGLDNVERIHKAMEGIKEQVGFEGTLAEFFAFMRTDPQFYYDNTDEGREAYLADAKAAVDEMRKALPDYFGLLPEAEITVKRVEPFREESAGKAFYQSPAQDGSRPGIYYANLFTMDAMPSYQLEALAFHEGIPGHHMQRAISQELEGIPQFQKFLSATAYTEGWGLYAEELAKDMGFYDDPYSDFGRLAMELWRACRLVVDTGIHDKQWSREEAIQYLLDNTPNPEHDVVKAIERYIAMPGQATAYMIGKLKIMELREKAKTALGEKFSIADFHDEVLKDGPVPLSVLEQKIDHWIKQQQSS